MAGAGDFTPATSSQRKPRGNLARLVSKFEVLDIKHGADRKSPNSPASGGPPRTYDGAEQSGLKGDRNAHEHIEDGQSLMGLQTYDGANDMIIDVCLSRASSYRWPSHMLSSNTDDGRAEDDLPVSPTRALMSRQKSVAERRKAFESKLGRGKEAEFRRLVIETTGKDDCSLPPHTLDVSSVDTSIGDLPINHDRFEHVLHVDGRLPEDDNSLDYRSWTTSVTEWLPAKDIKDNSSLTKELSEASSDMEDDPTSGKKETSPFEDVISASFLAIKYDKTPDIARELSIDPNTTLGGHMIENSPSHELLQFTRSPMKVEPSRQADDAMDLDSHAVMKPMSLCSQQPLHTEVPGRTAPTDAENNSDPPGENSTSLRCRLDNMPSFPGHNYVTNHQSRHATLPYLWERARGKMLERPSYPRVARQSILPASRTAEILGEEKPQKPGIAPSRTCGPGCLMEGSKPWTVRQHPSPLKDRIGLFKALSRNESKAQSPSSIKRPRVSMSRHTAGKVKEALRIFSLSNDKRQDGSTTGATAQATGVQSPRAWGTSRLFRSDTSSAALSSGKALLGHFRITSRTGLSSEDSAPTHRPLNAMMDGDADSAITSQAGPAYGPLYHSPHPSPSPSDDPDIRNARQRRGAARNDAPRVCRAYCKLEQPKPVRVGDMRRLVSLCKDKVTKHMFRGD